MMLNNYLNKHNINIDLLIIKSSNINHFFMNMASIHKKANCQIAAIYGSSSIPESGFVVVFDEGKRYKVHFIKKETGWIITGAEEI